MSFLALTTILVDDYDKAIDFFTQVLDFDLREDSASETNDGRPKRWVVVGPHQSESALLVAKADGKAQRALIGTQFGGRVGFFLRVDNFEVALDRLTAAEVELVGQPRTEPYGQVVVFTDPWGNKWDLLG